MSNGMLDVFVAIFAVFFVCLIIGGGCWAYPQYSVWQQGLAGKAALARAEEDRKIQIAVAKAKKESASHLAEAEVVRARGVAEAQKIINQTLTDRYIEWLLAEGMNEQQCEVRYIATEGSLPIIERK